MSLVFVDLGWVELYFRCSIVCPILLVQMGIWQVWLGSLARWWNIQIKVNTTQVHDHQIYPVQIDLFSGHLLLVVERGHRGPVHQSPRRVGRDEGIVLVVLTCKM